MRSQALADAIADTTIVRITRVGEFDPRHRARTKALFATSDVAALERLRRSLAVDEAFFEQRVSLMTPGVLDLNFSAGHALRATVSYLVPGLIRWRGWRSDARLVNADDLAAWLSEHGWEAPRWSP